jgi:hypothetical protein
MDEVRLFLEQDFNLLPSALYSEKFTDLFVGNKGEEKAAFLHFVDRTLKGISSVKVNEKIQFPSSSCILYPNCGIARCSNATQAFHEAGFVTKWMEHDMKIRGPRKLGFAGLGCFLSIY